MPFFSSSFFFFFFFFQYSALSKIFCQISVKHRHAHVQFYLRRVQSLCSVDVRFHGNRKALYANIKNLILLFFHDRRHFCTLERNTVVTQHLTSRLRQMHLVRKRLS